MLNIVKHNQTCDLPLPKRTLTITLSGPVKIAFDINFVLHGHFALFSVNTEEENLTKVVVKLVIPGFAVEKKLFGSAKPKPGATECDVKFDAM